MSNFAGLLMTAVAPVVASPPPFVTTTTEPPTTTDPDMSITAAGTLKKVTGAASVSSKQNVSVAGVLGAIVGAVSADPAAAFHRYWRINVTAGATAFPDVGMEWSRLKLNESGTEVATSSMTWSASSTFSGYGASKVSNPPTAPGWASNFSGFSPPVWIMVDLGVGNPHSIDEIKLTPVQATRAPGAFTVDYSDDGMSWTTKGTYSLITGWTNATERTISVP